MHYEQLLSGVGVRQVLHSFGHDLLLALLRGINVLESVVNIDGCRHFDELRSLCRNGHLPGKLVLRLGEDRKRCLLHIKTF